MQILPKKLSHISRKPKFDKCCSNWKRRRACATMVMSSQKKTQHNRPQVLGGISIVVLLGRQGLTFFKICPYSEIYMTVLTFKVSLSKDRKPKYPMRTAHIQTGCT